MRNLGSTILAVVIVVLVVSCPVTIAYNIGHARGTTLGSREAASAAREAKEATDEAQQAHDYATGLEKRCAEASRTVENLREDITDLKAEVEDYRARESRQRSQVPSASPIHYSGAFKRAEVSWYGPRFYGRHTASGAVLTRGMMNCAHKRLPFGTKVEFRYKGKTVIATVNDRGPYVPGRLFDLGPGTAKALGFSGVHTVEWRIVSLHRVAVKVRRMA